MNYISLQTPIAEQIPLRHRFLDGMSRVAASVSVVTTDGTGGPALR